MQSNDDYERRIQALEKRVKVLENIINGTSKNKPGRKPFLSSDKKNEIICKYMSGGYTYARLATEYGVSKTTISNICSPAKKKRIILPVYRDEHK